LEGQRVQMINISSAMGGQFAWSSAELTEEIKRMGSNPLKRKATDASKRAGKEQ
jgi:coenzyme F420-reducing hydrogenase delta subunit